MLALALCSVLPCRLPALSSCSLRCRGTMQEFRQLWEMPNMYAPQARPGPGLDSTRRSSGETGKLKQVRMPALHQIKRACPSAI